VEQHKNFLDDLVSEFVDILIANEDEAYSFTGHKNERMAIEALGKKAEVAALKLGKRGSLISWHGEVTSVLPMIEGEAVDTTGAGDLWAAGFLYALARDFPMETCGKLASACGWEACRVVGATIPDHGWDRILKLLEELI